eukprot:sb/3472626/
MYLDEEDERTPGVSSMNPDWAHTKRYTHNPVTEQLISYLSEEPLIVRVWGKQKLARVQSSANLTTRQLKTLNEKEKISQVMKKMAATPGNTDMAVMMRKIDMMLKIINDVRGCVTDAKKAGKSTVKVEELDKILTADNASFEDVQEIIENEKNNPDSKVCSIQ